MLESRGGEIHFSKVIRVTKAQSIAMTERGEKGEIAKKSAIIIAERTSLSDALVSISRTSSGKNVLGTTIAYLYANYYYGERRRKTSSSRVTHADGVRNGEGITAKYLCERRARPTHTGSVRAKPGALAECRSPGKLLDKLKPNKLRGGAARSPRECHSPRTTSSPALPLI